jgi:hypothetical protein
VPHAASAAPTMLNSMSRAILRIENSLFTL